MFFSLLAEAAGEPSFLEKYWLIFVLLALIIVMYIVSFTRKKKYNQQTQDLLNNLKPGDKIKTYSGFYGTIVSIKETTDGKVLLVETGEGSKSSYTTIDANAVYAIDQKEDVVYDKDGNIILPEEKTDSVKTEKAEKSKAKEVTVSEAVIAEPEVKVEEVKEEQVTILDGEPVKKTTKSKTKKPAAKPKASK